MNNKRQYLLEKFKTIIKNKRLIHLYLFETVNNNENTLSFIFDLAYEFLKNDCFIPNLKYLIKKFSYPNFYYLSSSKDLLIKKEQILEMKRYFYQTSLLQTKKVYVINQIENISYEAANSLLYFLENPINNDTLGILITNNHNSVLSTIVSRSQLFYLDFFLITENRKDKTFLLNNNLKDKLDNILNFLLDDRFLKNDNKETENNYYITFKKFFLVFVNNLQKNFSFIHFFLDNKSLLDEKKFINDFLFVITRFFLDLYFFKRKMNFIFPLNLLNTPFFNKLSLEDVNIFLNIFLTIEQKSYVLDSELCFMFLFIEIEKIQKNFLFEERNKNY
ncbi:DNA polymerase III, delta subunit [Candidatus Phytoplasma oryzae]|uniref:DNA polymerase III, delta subunit n=1 Tax=Candidatus Phytoplasma oryzae TaxID=203274 RepID=A0A139JQA2_9MOLU|nr:hypothetical protein [Candidatus Phytoplasma oryzae]KXT29139.1 DNA polymerase III, delta subunit [Candidatus Phytoplasma oryzae]RAM57755.1 hypothetical protein DH96_01485 [Candidatus Phytoplasma oryzae]